MWKDTKDKRKERREKWNSMYKYVAFKSIRKRALENQHDGSISKRQTRKNKRR